MIVIHVQVQVKADKAADFVTAARQDSQQGLQQAGCLAYQWMENLNTPHKFSLYEEWETQAAFDAYRTSDAFKQVGAVLMPLLDGAPRSDYYTAAALETA